MRVALGKGQTSQQAASTEVKSCGSMCSKNVWRGLLFSIATSADLSLKNAHFWVICVLIPMQLAGAVYMDYTLHICQWIEI